MSQDKLKLWVGVGAYLLSGAATPMAFQANARESQIRVAQPLAQTFHPGMTVAADGGEGGEGGEGEETKPSDTPTPSPQGDQSGGKPKPSDTPSPQGN